MHKIEKPTSNKIYKSNIDNQIKSNVGLSINIIGQHVDEALKNVEKYLDDCRLKNLKQVKIIHGLGSGALRKAVQDYLKKCNFVASFKSGDQFDGGFGVTQVNLK